MKSLASLVIIAFSLVLVPQLAHANDSKTASSVDAGDVGVGARIGGYGFRSANGDKLDWTDCRMNGVGAFGTLDFAEHFFAELGADHYFATGETLSSGMDRHSTFISAAIGARMMPDFIVSPYLQIGGGPEFTKIDVDGHSLRKTTPTAFVGVGGELNLGDFHFGTHLRAYSMAHPLHGESADDAHSHLANGDSIAVEQEVAGQMQFFVRYSL